MNRLTYGISVLIISGAVFLSSCSTNLGPETLPSTTPSTEPTETEPEVTTKQTTPESTEPGSVALVTEKVVERYGQLTTKGTMLWSSKGEQVVLCMNFFTPDVVQTLAEDWGCDVLRITINGDADTGYMKEPDKYFDPICKIIDMCVNQGIYVIVDWKTLYNEQYSGADDLVKAITDSMNVITTEGSLEFEKDGNDWKISKITKLDELLEFGKKSPNLTNKEMPTKPADDTDPTDEPAFPTGTQFADSYQKAIAAYLKVLDDNMAAITAVQETFRIDPVGIYDIDGNGIPELYFLACKDSSQVMNSSLFIYSYNENAGEALKQIEVPDIIYMAGSGGLFQMYATSNRLIITHAGGEDSDFKYWTEIYNFQWDLIASYRRNYLYDYNAPEDQATTVKYYEEEAEITEEQYNKVFKEDANNAVIVLARNYTPSPSDVEYPLVSKPSFAMLSYESAYTYLESLRS